MIDVLRLGLPVRVFEQGLSSQIKRFSSPKTTYLPKEGTYPTSEQLMAQMVLKQPYLKDLIKEFDLSILE